MTNKKQARQGLQGYGLFIVAVLIIAAVIGAYIVINNSASDESAAGPSAGNATYDEDTQFSRKFGNFAACVKFMDKEVEATRDRNTDWLYSQNFYHPNDEYYFYHISNQHDKNNIFKCDFEGLGTISVLYSSELGLDLDIWIRDSMEGDELLVDKKFNDYNECAKFIEGELKSNKHKNFERLYRGLVNYGSGEVSLLQVANSGDSITIFKCNVTGQGKIYAGSVGDT